MLRLLVYIAVENFVNITVSKHSCLNLREYLDSSFVSLFTEGLNVHVKLFFCSTCGTCAHFYLLYFNWNFLKM